MCGVTVKTPTDLDSLPNLSIVIDDDGIAFQKRVALSPTPWRAYGAAGVGLSSGALMSYHHPITLVYAPGIYPGCADARPEALLVTQDVLAAKLGLSNDTDSIAQRIIDVLSGDGLIHYSPAPWDFTPDCAMRVRGPGMIPPVDLDVAPPGSVVFTETGHIWKKTKDSLWQWQGDQGYGEPTVLDLDTSKEPKDAPTLTQEGPMVLITTEWKE